MANELPRLGVGISLDSALFVSEMRTPSFGVPVGLCAQTWLLSSSVRSRWL
jgi:hypothetical protein